MVGTRSFTSLQLASADKLYVAGICRLPHLVLVGRDTQGE
jgi:hypothetical protein